MKYCPKCYTANEDEAAFCGSCGAPMNAAQGATAAAPPAYSPNQTQAYQPAPTYPQTGPTGPQPQAAPAYPPQAPTYPPQAAPAYPQQAPTYPPQQAPTYPPQAAPTYPPQAAPTYPPQAAPTYPPQAAPTYPPQAAPTYPPQQVPTYPAQPVAAAMAYPAPVATSADAQALAAAQAAGMILPAGTAPAGFGIRLGAMLIDGVIMGIVGYLVPSLSYFFGPVYCIVMWALMGRTLGKMALGLRVVSVDGQPLSWGKAVVRYLGYIVSSLMLCIGFLAIAFDGARRGVHDRIAKTIVVRNL